MAACSVVTSLMIRDESWNYLQHFLSHFLFISHAVINNTTYKESTYIPKTLTDILMKLRQFLHF